MKKYILASILSAGALLSAGIAFADYYAPGAGYDPDSPAEPAERYVLVTEVYPANAGWTYNYEEPTILPGTSVFIDANPHSGYAFEGWYEGDKKISSAAYFYYTMPARSVKLTAKFNLLDPSGPMEDGYTHRVYVTCDPQQAGEVDASNIWSNKGYYLLKEGDYDYLYAYPREGFKFTGWVLDNAVVTPNEDGTPRNPLMIQMVDKDINVIAKFTYAPNDPGDPMPNSYNHATHELIVDNFSPGNLQGTINQLLSEHRYNVDASEIYSIIVAGKMYYEDCFFNFPFYGVSKLDLARTTGVEELGYGTFYRMEALTDVILPSSLEYLDSNSFLENPNLSVITCYAKVPPGCNEEYFYTPYEGVIAKVPAMALALYKEANGWKNLILQPIESADCSITVTLPADYIDGRYKGMYLVLENPSTGQTQRYVINDSPTYVFENLIMNTEGLSLYYNIYLRNQKGEELAVIPDIFLREFDSEGNSGKNPEFTITDVKRLYDITAKVIQPEDGKDIASDVEIVWKDSDGEYLGSGAKVSGMIEGKDLTMTVTLPDSYGVRYKVPASQKIVAGENGNTVTINLVAYDRDLAKGKLTDAWTHEGIRGGYVTVEQTLAGKYRHTATGVTNAEGEYQLEYIKDAAATGKVTARADGYVNQPCTIENFENWDEMKDFEMKLITGTMVNVALEWLSPGAEKATVYTDYSNIDFALENVTSGRKIENFSNQAPVLVIPDEAGKGEEIKVIVTSRNGLFEEACGYATLDDEGKANVNITIKEHGKLTSSYANSDASNVTALLYDKEGKLIKHTLYNAKKSVSFSNLKEGNYTLVAFADSPYFTGFATIDDLLSFEGFDKGEDYLLETVNVSDATLKEVKFDNVPMFDESQFYKTDPALTLLKVNKTSVTAGNYVTLSTRFNFLPQYRGWAENVTLIYEFPEGVSYVKNSLVNGDENSNLTDLGNNKYMLENVVPGSTVRFCVMPEKGGNYYPTASLEFDYQGTPYTQPLGSFYFEGVDFKIYVPAKTCHKSVWARGVAGNGNDVTIFVNGAPLSSARAAGNGDWLAEVPLMDPENIPIQQIYGEIVSESKGSFPTQSALVEYDPSFPELANVTMMHNGQTVVFEHPKAKTSAKSYSYNPDRDMFTLTAQFNENKERVKAVNFHILSTDGSEREIDAVKNSGTGIWVAALGYPDSFRLPVNVTVDYTYEKEANETQTLESFFFMGYVAPDVQPIIDPSGFVYEAQEDNRLEGATVTIFYREAETNMFDEITWQTIKWNAAEYGQENPLLTDKEGLYGWDVPSGEWQVKYEKKGYETAYSKWLQVPPPQLEVNVGLVRNDAPGISDVRAYDGQKGIEIIFDHYMNFESLTNNAIYIIKDNADPEADPEFIYGEVIKENVNETHGDDSEYSPLANTVRFIPNEPIPTTTNQVYLIVSRNAKSYSGVEMTGDFGQWIPVVKEITAVAADEESLEVEEGKTWEIVVSATPADAAYGKKLHVANQSPLIVGFSDPDNQLNYEENALVLEFDEKGQAKIQIEGLLLGQSQLDFSVEGSLVKGKTLVDVVAEVIKVSRPSSTLPDRSEVYRGALAELSSKYPEGEIYYTLDGSEPTTSSTRYTGAIKIDRNMTLRAIVVVGDRISEIADFNYTLKGGAMELSVNEGWSWISHHLESPVSIETVLTGDISRILSQTQEVIWDKEYGFVGNLTELHPHSSYKVESKKSGKITLNDVFYNPEDEITLKKGWNWIGYPLDQQMHLDEAFEENYCEDGDVIETIGGGSARFANGTWIGDLQNEGMNPGIGYLYYSVSDKNLKYNHRQVSLASARLNVQPKSTAPWAADKYRYASLMPIVADVIKADGTIAEKGEYEVAAFSGSECRGVGVYVDGYVFLTVHGNPGEEINFRLMPTAQGAEELQLEETLTFTLEPVGTLDAPYQLNTKRTGVKAIHTDSEVTVTVRNRELYVSGDGVTQVSVFDMAGNKVLNTRHTDGGIALDTANVGVYIVAVQNNGEWSYHKVMVK